MRYALLRSAGAVFAASLIAVAFGSAASAQTPDTPNGPCFDIVRPPSGDLAGAILLNRCNGKTWILVTSRRNDRTTYRWSPVATGEAAVSAAPEARARPARPRVRYVRLNPKSDKCFTFQARTFCE